MICCNIIIKSTDNSLACTQPSTDSLTSRLCLITLSFSGRPTRRTHSSSSNLAFLLISRSPYDNELYKYDEHYKGIDPLSYAHYSHRYPYDAKFRSKMQPRLSSYFYTSPYRYWDEFMRPL